MSGSARTARRIAAAGVLVAFTLTAAPLTRAATPAPAFFAVRLEGTALRTSGTVQARTLDPGTGYSFAKIDSTTALDGSRDLQMKATGTTNDPGNLGGAALFSPDSATSGTSSFPNFSEAFHPAFEEVGQSDVAEKCVLNADAKETPECRDQPGPYALARVVPDADAPAAEGFARNAGAGEQGGESVTRSRITVTDAGALEGVQRNEGRALGVPDTPIVVESFLTTSTVLAGPDGVTVAGECSATVSVGGQPVASDAELQALLGPLTGTAVEYQPPTEAVVTETFGGTKEVACTGARFLLTTSEGTAVLTYGQTFATASPPSDGGGLGGSIGEVVGGPIGAGGSLARSPAPGVAGTTTAAPAPSTATSGPAPSASGPAPAPGAGPAPAAAADPAGAGATGSAAGPALVRSSIDTMPIAVTTAVAATALPLGVLLLWAVVGSLARGLPTLRFPPFRD